MGRLGLASCAVVLLGCCSVSAAPRDADPPRLRLAAEKAAAEVVARNELPRFEERIEVRHARDAFEAYLRGVDLSCGASERGAPTRYEMNAYRGSPIPVHADFVPAAKLLYSKVKGLFSSKEPRFFLYAVRRDAGPRAAGPGAVDFFVREGRLPEPPPPLEPGTHVDLVAGFREQAQAVTALRRLERGLSAPDPRETGRAAPSVVLDPVPRAGLRVIRAAGGAGRRCSPPVAT